MYSVLDKEEKAVFAKETETVISMRGQSSTLAKTINYFDIVVKDTLDKSLEFPCYSGAYHISDSSLIITKMRLLDDDDLIGDSIGLQKAVAEAALKRFMKLAKVNMCRSLIVYTGEMSLVEEMFKLKFHMVKMVSPNYEVRSEVNV